MLFAVAVVAASIIVSGVVAVIVGGAYEAIVDRRWPADIPASVVAVVVLSVTAGAYLGANFI